MEVSCQLYALAAVCPGKQHLVPRKKGGAQSLSGLYEEQKKISSFCRGSNADSSVVLLVAQSLYRLSYHCPEFTVGSRMLIPTEQSVSAVSAVVGCGTENGCYT
jgi:hypothetical protein